MRTPNSAAILLLGIIVGCAAERVLAVPPARAGTTPQRWEYACERVNWEPQNVTRAANEFGQQGWEMSAAMNTVWCFKRPLQ
jgi:hypothetical protein